jgi:predicted chitinase
MLTLKQFEEMAPFAPKERLAKFYPYLTSAMTEFGITTPKRVAAFVAQLLHESGSFKYMEEIASGEAYEPSANPKLAQKLGNLKEGDGKRYKGRGAIQLTGRANYRAAGAALKLPLEEQPQLAAQPDTALRVAGWYWQTHGLNELADAGKFDEITKKINGGYNGLDDRRKHWALAKAALGI